MSWEFNGNFYACIAGIFCMQNQKTGCHCSTVSWDEIAHSEAPLLKYGIFNGEVFLCGMFLKSCSSAQPRNIGHVHSKLLAYYTFIAVCTLQRPISLVESFRRDLSHLLLWLRNLLQLGATEPQSMVYMWFSCLPVCVPVIPEVCFVVSMWVMALYLASAHSSRSCLC